MKKGIVYYTDNILEKSFAEIVRKRLKISASDIPIVWVSHKSIQEENNIVWNDIGCSHHSICLQILLGVQALKADVIYFAEHDVIYHPSHFDFIPPKENVFYYNLNRWWLRASDGLASMKSDVPGALSQLVAYKGILEKHYIERIAGYESGINVRKEAGVEPGKHKSSILTTYQIDTFCSKWPNVDIRHDRNMTISDRFKKRKYILADGIPWWGKTEGRYEEFISGING